MVSVVLFILLIIVDASYRGY
ncbi:YjcZ family sporulation protein [Bacillus sp. JJ1521]